MPVDWINDDRYQVKPFPRYLVDDKNHGKWLTQATDGEHEIYITTKEDRVLGSKLCTPFGPLYYLYDQEDVGLIDVDRTLSFDNVDDIDEWYAENPKGPTGRRVKFVEFQRCLLEYRNNKGEVYCCGKKRPELPKPPRNSEDKPWRPGQ
jgi:hypothetical protein